MKKIAEAFKGVVFQALFLLHIKKMLAVDQKYHGCKIEKPKNSFRVGI